MKVFQYKGSPFQYIWLSGILRILSLELSKPVSPENSEMDYLPTQYLTALIKSKGYDGMIYNSSLDPGKNLAIFVDNKIRVESIFKVKINGIKYSIEHC